MSIVATPANPGMREACAVPGQLSSESRPHPSICADRPAAPAGLRVWRYEFKYALPVHLRGPLLADLRAFTVFDPHAGPQGYYTVRSLYLDSPEWSCFYDKTAGVAERHKLRIRAYPDRIGRFSTVKFEVKCRDGQRVSKDVAALSLAEYEQLRPLLGQPRLPGTDWLEACPALRTFFILKQLHGRVPVLNLEYRRQALRARRERRVRITLDDRMRACRSRDLPGSLSAGRPILSALQSVLEVKVDETLPYWMHRLIDKYRLRVQSVSKYALAVAGGPFGLDGMM